MGKKSATYDTVADDIDIDVMEEKRKVNAMTPNDFRVNNLVLQKLTKLYRNFRAVKQVSVAVQR